MLCILNRILAGQSTHASMEHITFMTLKPGDIIEKIKQTPPFQQNNVEASYSGQKVTWKVYFHSIRQIQGDTNWHVMSRDADMYPWIYFDIDINNYPQFRILHIDDALEVTGVIDRVSGHDINLKDVEKISFPGNDQVNVSQVSESANASIAIIPWHQGPIGQILIGLVVVLIGGGILYCFGWN